MEFINVSVMFKLSILFYIVAAFSSIILINRHKLCNIISNIDCVIASLFGLTASIIYIFFTKEKIAIHIYKSLIPFGSFNIIIDKLSAFFILSLSILVLCVSLYSIGYISHYYKKRNVGLFNFLYSTFILSMIFVMSSGNVVFFFISWEVMSVLSYFLVVFESEQKENQRAGTLYIIMTHVGAAFLLIAFMIMFSYTRSFDMYTSSSAIPTFAKNLMFAFFFLGFATKAGAIPIHIWLPYAHPAAPSNISALMSGIMLKTAIYGILRFILMYLGIQNTWWGVVILVVGIISAVIGVAYAFIENNIKKLLAYSSIENIGIIFIAIGVSFIAFSTNSFNIGILALVAALFHAFNHTLFKGSLFLGAGSIHYSTHTKNIEELGGLIKRMPITSVLVLGGSLAISSLIPFNGFVSEWLIFQSLFANIIPGNAGLNILTIFTVAALGLSGALAAACFIKLFGISFLGLPRSEHSLEAKEVPLIMNIGMGILVLCCLVLGIFPMFFLTMADHVISGLIGSSIVSQLKGWYFLVYYPVDMQPNTISPFLVLTILVSIIFISLLLIRIVGRKYIERKYGTWDCGFEALNSRMQYSATGFSKPIKIVFRILFRPSRELKLQGTHKYYPDKIEYKTARESIIEKYVYEPLLILIRNFSRRTKYSVQTGSIHLYIVYIFITVLALMLYNGIS